MSLLSQQTLRCGQTTSSSISWPRSGVRHIFQWLLGSFSEHPRWWHGPCMRCSVTFGCISSQCPASFSLALPSKPMTHKRTEICIRQGSASVSSLIKEIFLLSLYICFSFVRAAVVCAILERASGFEPSSETIAQTYLKLLSFNLDLPLDVIIPPLWKSGGYIGLHLSVPPSVRPSVIP